MKIGVKVSHFNQEMRKRRKEAKLTQAELALFVGTTAQNISLIERLLKPIGHPRTAAKILSRIARELNCSFNILFPPDYIDALKDGWLPRHSSFDFCIEVSLDALPDIPFQAEFELEDIVDQVLLREKVEEKLRLLPPRERKVVEERYLNQRTLDEVSIELGVTKERVRQIEAKALSRLRHPRRKEDLRGFL